MSFKLSFYQILKNRLIPVIFLLYYLLLLPVLSNALDYKFKHININDGLSQNAIFAILKDSRGFMWFGTKDGLNKYDGYNFVVYQHNPFDTTTISASYVTSIYEDSRGLIWVGTYDGGLNIFNRNNDIFRRINLGADGISLRKVYEIKAIKEDADGNIWVATNGDGLFKIQVNPGGEMSFTAKRFRYEEGNTNSISSNKVLSLCFDKKGVLWLGTENGLNQFDLKSGKVVNHVIRTKNQAAHDNTAQLSISSVYESSNGTLWAGTLGGLVKFNKADGSYRYFPHRFDVFRYGWGNIVDISEDSGGNLWLATAAELMKFDAVNEKYSSFVHNPPGPQSISFNSVPELYFDFSNESGTEIIIGFRELKPIETTLNWYIFENRKITINTEK